MTKHFSSIVFALVAMFPAGCKTAEKPEDTSAAKGGVSETLVDIATLGQTNVCREFRDVAFNDEICTSLRNGKPLSGTNTGVCRFYCDGRNSCVSPFVSRDSLLAAIVKVEKFVTVPTGAVWAGVQNGEKIRGWLEVMLPWVKGQLQTWKPMMASMDAHVKANKSYTNSMCAMNVVSALSNLILELEKLNAGLDPARRGDFDEASVTQTVAKISCLLISATSSCGTQLGVPPPILALAAAGNFGCMAANFAASAIQCQQARDCCTATAQFATGVAMPTTESSGEVSRTCCRCNRQTWHDRTWPRSDVMLAEAPWGSVVTDTSQPTIECEKREGKKFSQAIPDAEGRWTYYWYTGCRKERVKGDQCWISQ